MSHLRRVCQPRPIAATDNWSDVRTLKDDPRLRTRLTSNSLPSSVYIRYPNTHKPRLSAATWRIRWFVSAFMVRRCTMRQHLGMNSCFCIQVCCGKTYGFFSITFKSERCARSSSISLEDADPPQIAIIHDWFTQGSVKPDIFFFVSRVS